MDAEGKIYYIDHNTHRTSWKKPRYLERQPTTEETGGNVGPTEQVGHSCMSLSVYQNRFV